MALAAVGLGLLMPVITCTGCARPFSSEEAAAIAREEQELCAALMVNTLGIEWACEECAEQWINADGAREQERRD